MYAVGGAKSNFNTVRTAAESVVSKHVETNILSTLL